MQFGISYVVIKFIFLSPHGDYKPAGRQGSQLFLLRALHKAQHMGSSQ